MPITEGNSQIPRGDPATTRLRVGWAAWPTNVNMGALTEKTIRNTADDPVMLELATDDSVLSRVAVWQESGDVVMRSLDYDVFASGSNLHEAILQFVIRTVDYANFLADDPTEDDSRVVAMLNSRVARVLAMIEHQEEMARRRPLPVRVFDSVARRPKERWQLRPAALT